MQPLSPPNPIAWPFNRDGNQWRFAAARPERGVNFPRLNSVHRRRIVTRSPAAACRLSGSIKSFCRGRPAFLSATSRMAEQVRLPVADRPVDPQFTRRLDATKFRHGVRPAENTTRCGI